MTPFPISETSPIVFAGPVPTQADLVVVGGGVVGTTTALYAARAGLRVVLCEKGRIAGEQSSRNWGWIRRQGRDPHELPIMIEADRLWRELDRETNVDIGLREQGVTYLTRSSREFEHFEDWMGVAQSHALETQLFDSSALDRRFPEFAGQGYVGAMHTARDMRAEPWIAVPALAEIAVREGAAIAENCAVRALDMVGGKVAGVITESGRISAPRVVLAGGAWSSLFLRAHGVSIPQLSVRASVVQTDPVELPHAGGAVDEKVAFRTRADGGLSIAAPGFHELFIGPDAFRNLKAYLPQLRADPFGTRFLPAAPRGFPDSWSTARHWSPDTVSPFESQRVLNPSPNMTQLRRTIGRIEKMFPKVGSIRPRSAWAGMIDTMPDVVPVVDHVSALPGLIVGCGMSGHGFGIGPAMGRILADLSRDQDPGHDLSRFRLSRFSDGSTVAIGPSV